MRLSASSGFRLVLLSIVFSILSGCSLLGGFGGWSQEYPGSNPGSEAGAPQAPPADPDVPSFELPEREVLVYYTEAEPYFGHPSTEKTLELYPDRITAVIGFWYQVDRASLDRLVPFGSATPQRIRDAAAIAARGGIQTKMLFHNLLYGQTRWSKEAVIGLLNDPGAQERLIRDIRDTAASMGMSGVDIDLENVDPSLREPLSRFVEKLSDLLHQDGLTVSIAVPAKTWDDPGNSWSGAFDYARIGRAVDRVILMTYDEHGYSSGPGPIASSGWVEDAVGFAVSQVPSRKVAVGIAGYGFDWPSAGRPRYISHAQAVQKAAQVGAQIRWDGASNSPYYTYVEDGVRREVWFENASSSTWKLDLVEKYDLAGIALWRGGLEDPDLWRVIGQKFKVRKD